jgi:IS605 OrfB family transposase
MLNEKRKKKEKMEVNITSMRSYPIIIYPTNKQKHIILNWFEIYRQVYNLTVSYLKTNKIQSFYKMRTIIDNRINNLSGLSGLLGLIKKYKITKQTRDNAINDCLKAYKSALANYKAGNIKYFRLRYKKKSCINKGCVLEVDAFSKKVNGFVVKTLGEMKSKLPLQNINKATRLCYNSNNNRFCIRVPYEKKTNKEFKKLEYISLDPGMRVFQTGYTPDGNCYQICTEKTSIQIKKLIERIEKPNTENPNYIKYVKRLREKLKNKIDDLHWKTAHILCKFFKVIVIGNMSTKGIISRNLNLPKIVKKYCSSLSHYTFQQRLIQKAEELGSEVIVMDESYTSKTCGGCGEIDNNLGSSKIFICKNCEFKCDRDVNGARNILLKYLSSQLN